MANLPLCVRAWLHNLSCCNIGLSIDFTQYKGTDTLPYLEKLTGLTVDYSKPIIFYVILFIKSKTTTVHLYPF